MGKSERDRWNNPIEFFLSLVGFAVGLGNVWRFPYLCFQNGGAAFMIPYFIFTLLIGVPLFSLEVGIGQRFQMGSVALWRKISIWSSGIGLCQCLISFIVSLYYNVLIAYSLYYFFVSFTTNLPWSEIRDENGVIVNDASTYFFDDVLRVTDSINHLGNMNMKLLGAFACSWFLIFGILFMGVKSAGKVVYVTVIFPYVVLLVLLVRGVTLPGASKGLHYFLVPQWEKLLDPKVWVNAAQQVMFSLSIGFGTYITFGSFNSPDYKFMKDTWIVPAINALTSIISGLAVFGVLGFLAEKQGVDVAELPLGGVKLAFIAYPTAISLLPFSAGWAIMFFLMLASLGIDSQFAITETVVTAVSETFGIFKNKKWILVMIMCIISFLLGLPFMTDGGMYLLDAVDSFINAFGIFLIVYAEILTVGILYGFKNFINDIKTMTSETPSKFILLCWKTATPILALCLFVVGIWQVATRDYSDVFCRYPESSECLETTGWARYAGFTLSIVVVTPLFISPFIIFIKNKFIKKKNRKSSTCETHVHPPPPESNCQTESESNAYPNTYRHSDKYTLAHKNTPTHIQDTSYSLPPTSPVSSRVSSISRKC
eukprot:GHVR01116650.1.p1 GENE.GHVR01116650.1~~GHVR01116650.1.p1  ORF type:complete len:598 (+),score=74.30 GHVR01116650.1:289-2082(+)